LGRQRDEVSCGTGTLGGQSYSFPSRTTSLTDGAGNALASVGNQVFDLCKGDTVVAGLGGDGGGAVRLSGT
jgi:hypothetical protein